MKYLPIILVLAGCTAPSTDTIYRTDGERVDLAYIILAPLCMLLCQTTVSSTGSRVEGGGSTTQSTTQSPSSTGGT